MKRETKKLCLISAISFIAGVMMGPFTMIALSELISPNRYQKNNRLRHSSTKQ
jgi:hypothetical protein